MTRKLNFWNKYLCHVIDEHGITADPEKFETITNIRPPTTVKKVLEAWYGDAVGSLIQLLIQLIQKDTPWLWDNKLQDVVNRLKKKITDAPFHCITVLGLLDLRHEFILQTDAMYSFDSKERQTDWTRYCLCQQIIDQDRKKLSHNREKYLAVVWGMNRMTYYLQVQNNHWSLEWLINRENPGGRIARWLFYWQEFDFGVVYRKCTNHVIADTWSRQLLIID